MRFELTFDAELSILLEKEFESCTKQERKWVSKARHSGNYSKLCSRYMLMILQTPLCDEHLVEEADDLSCNVLASCLLVVHDTGRGCEDDVSELTGWQKLDDPLLEICQTDVVPWGDHTSLVETIVKSARYPATGTFQFLPAVQLNDNLAGSVVINFLEFADVTWRENVSM